MSGRPRGERRPPSSRRGPALVPTLLLLLAVVAVTAAGVLVERRGADEAARPDEAGTTAGATSPAELVRVVDGDTLRVRVDGAERAVRLIGIDTPEVHRGVECGGPEASALMASLVREGDPVTLVADATQQDVDRYDRLLRYVELDGDDLGLAQLEAGWAEVYRTRVDFSRMPAYREAARAARDDRAGVWSACPAG